MSDREWHCLDWSKIPLSTLRLPTDERTVAITKLIRSQKGETPPSSFCAATPMRVYEEALVVFGFCAGAALLCSLPILVVHSALIGSVPMLATVFALCAGLAVHPLPVVPSLHSSYAVSLLFRYFSFKFVWQGSRDLSARSASTAPWIGYGVPHGVFPFGNLLCTAAFSLFGVDFVGTCADVVFRVPLLRCLTMLGVVSASKRTITRQLGKQVNVGLVPDGIAGIFATSSEIERVAVAKRRGAARLALELGVTVHPAFLLGNSRCFDVLPSGRLERLSRALRVSLMVFWGRAYLPIPRRQPIVFTFGEPVRVETIAATPTDEQVAQVHERILQELRMTYKLVAPAYGWEGRPLEFV